MGCYDTIEFPCPACGKIIYAQTKSGVCVLASYKHTDVPIDAAQDANRHAPYECCGKFWALGNIPDLPRSQTSLVIVEVEQNYLCRGRK